MIPFTDENFRKKFTTKKLELRFIGVKSSGKFELKKYS